jgi:hypothetical protein
LNPDPDLKHCLEEKVPEKKLHPCLSCLTAHLQTGGLQQVESELGRSHASQSSHYTISRFQLQNSCLQLQNSCKSFRAAVCSFRSAVCSLRAAVCSFRTAVRASEQLFAASNQLFADVEQLFAASEQLFAASEQLLADFNTRKTERQLRAVISPLVQKTLAHSFSGIFFTKRSMVFLLT